MNCAECIHAGICINVTSGQCEDYVSSNELQALRDFAKFTRREVLDDMFEENSGVFAEVACRKLVKLGYVRVENGVYKESNND